MSKPIKVVVVVVDIVIVVFVKKIVWSKNVGPKTKKRVKKLGIKKIFHSDP